MQTKFIRAAGKSLLACLGLATSAMAVAPASSFVVTGKYVEGCSCGAPCACELTGIEMGCRGVGLFQFEKGSYAGADFSGSKAAYAVEPGKWLVLYIDAPTTSKSAALERFMKQVFKDWGKLEGVRHAKIHIDASSKGYVGKVDGGNVMTIVTEPILGGDGKTPLTYSNIHDPIHPVVRQGKTLNCRYDDMGHTFELKDTNAYFNGSISSRGTL